MAVQYNFSQTLSELAKGFENTVLLFFLTLLFALPLGLLISLGTTSRIKPIKWFLKGVVWVIRGTPLILQIVLISLIPFYVFGIPNKEITIFFDIMMADLLFVFCLIAFVINYACYFSEIFRGGIQSISKGQYEAGAVLGMKKKQVFRHIVLPQMTKRIVPPMSNEIITLVKDTSLARSIGVIEIIQQAEKVGDRNVSILPLFYAGAFFLIFNGLLTLLFGYIERKLDYYKI